MAIVETTYFCPFFEIFWRFLLPPQVIQRFLSLRTSKKGDAGEPGIDDKSRKNLKNP
jgi:hypothetical protein